MGELETNPLLAQGSSEDVVRFDNGSGSTPTFENVWHADVTFRERPALGAVLQLHEVPPLGGDTMWADMAAAYDNLPQEMKDRVDGATAVHDFIPGFARFYPPERLVPLQDAFPPVEHPVVRTHPETGRRLLFVNTSFTTRITGMDREESDRLLRYLTQQAHVPEYQVRFRWQPGDVAFWDNRATQHYAVNDYAPHPGWRNGSPSRATGRTRSPATRQHQARLSSLGHRFLSWLDGLEPLLDGDDIRPLREQLLGEESVHLGVGVEAAVRQDGEAEVQVVGLAQGVQHDGTRGDAGEHKAVDAASPEHQVEVAAREGAPPPLGDHDVALLRSDIVVDLGAGVSSLKRPASTAAVSALLRGLTSGCPGRNPMTT